MENPIDLITAGETLIDMISADYSETGLEGAISFNKHFGGSPGNIACNVAKQGFNSAMLTAVGNDGFGRFIIKNLNSSNVNTDYIQVLKKQPTSIVTVTKSTATPEFIAYRCADKYLDITEKELTILDKCKIFHVSSFALSQNPARNNLYRALKAAKAKGKLIGIDPNYREIMWDENFDGLSFMKKVIGMADFLKPSEDDAFQFFGSMSPKDYCKKFYELGAKFVMLTLGADGALTYDGKIFTSYKSLADRIVDTTGAGDAFWSGFYCSILRGFDMDKSVKLGSAFSAFKLKEVGAVVNLPKLDFLCEYFKL